MKKWASIFIALLILLAGMHITVAAHFCGGEIAATRLSISGIPASCGMESDNNIPHADDVLLKILCCENEYTVYRVGDDYSPSEFNFKLVKLNSDLHPMTSFVSAPLSCFISPNIHTNYSPPHNLSVHAVRITEICVFRL
jgi:hypothetical protein